jgi:hypothetical protein
MTQQADITMHGERGTVRDHKCAVATLGPWSLSVSVVMGVGVVTTVTAPILSGFDRLERTDGWELDLMSGDLRTRIVNVRRMSAQTWRVYGLPDVEVSST